MLGTDILVKVLADEGQATMIDDQWIETEPRT
jgi:hypothetical protein